ncbi:MAG: DUF2911 domain-containing protein [Ferruginibacter sp.]
MKIFRHSLRAIMISHFFAVTLLSCNLNKNNSDAAIIISDTIKSQEALNPYVTNDRSPMDMSYYPHDYPVSKMNGTDTTAPLARVIYSRPQKKGRVIFGNNSKSLCEYGKEWRLGANEATEIEFFRNVIINGKKIEKGRYLIYCIPYPEKWTIILNTNLFTWGLHLDKEKDIFKVDVPVELQAPTVEDFTMLFQPATYGADLLMAWDNVKTTLHIRTIP